MEARKLEVLEENHEVHQESEIERTFLLGAGGLFVLVAFGMFSAILIFAVSKLGLV